MGIESGSQRVLDAMDKRLTVGQNEIAVRVVRASGIYLKASFIFGYPGETRETAIESAKWRVRMGLKGKYFYATPYPGAPLYDDFIKKNEEEWLLKSASLKEFNINMTDMTDREFFRVDRECRKILKSYKRTLRNLIIKFVPDRILRMQRRVRLLLAGLGI